MMNDATIIAATVATQALAKHKPRLDHAGGPAISSHNPNYTNVRGVKQLNTAQSTRINDPNRALQQGGYWRF